MREWAFSVEYIKRGSYVRALGIARELGIEEFFTKYVKDIEQR